MCFEDYVEAVALTLLVFHKDDMSDLLHAIQSHYAKMSEDYTCTQKIPIAVLVGERRR